MVPAPPRKLCIRYYIESDYRDSEARTWQSWQGDLGISAGLSLIPRRGESPGFNVLERVDVNDSNKLDYAGLRVSSKPVLQIHVDTCNAESRPIINSQYH